MFKPIYNRHGIPANHRASLSRYFNRPNGIPRSLRPYFTDRKWSRFLRECSVALTRRFLTSLEN